MQRHLAISVESHRSRVLAVVFAVLLAASWSLSSKSNADDGDSGALPAVGDTATDFELSGPGDVTAKLSDLTSEGQVVVLVLRGWPGYQCPICSRQVGELIGKADEIAVAGESVVLIYPGPADGLSEHAEEFMEGTTLPDRFHFVIDPGYEFTNAWNLRWDAPRETAYPSTFVINGDNVITFAKISMTHGGRSNASEVLEALAD